MKKVRLLKDWEGYEKNSVIGLMDSDAERLIGEGIAEEVDSAVRMRVYGSEFAQDVEAIPECISEPPKKDK